MPTKGSTVTFTVAYSAAEDGIALRAALKKTTSTSRSPGRARRSTSSTRSSSRRRATRSLATGLGAEHLQHRVQRLRVRRRGPAPRASAPTRRPCRRARAPTPLCTSDKEVQFIAGLQKFGPDGVTPVDIYSRTNPATLLLQCDKTQCPGKGVSFYTAKASLSATGPLEVSDPCTSKGVIQSDGGLLHRLRVEQAEQRRRPHPRRPVLQGPEGGHVSGPHATQWPKR